MKTSTPFAAAHAVRTGTLLLTILVLFSGCGHRKPPGAVGANDEVSVFTNTPRGGAVADTIEHVYAFPIQVGPTITKGSEPAFRLDFPSYSRFATYKYVKNQIFAVNLSRDDDLAHDLPGMLGKAGRDRIKAHAPFRLLARDRWASGQTTLFAVAWSDTALLHLFTGADSTRLRQDYIRAVAEGLTQTMFGLGEEKELTDQVAREYGWTLRLLKGFYAAEDPKHDFVKFNAADPVRLILVHWVDEKVPLDADSWDPMLSNILKVYNDGDFFMPSLTKVRTVQFQGRPALRWDGIWQNEKYVIGGPFLAYAFQRGERSYLLIGQVFAPGSEKVPMLRQVDAMLHTFQLVR
jgi:hypothetical protein